MASILVNPPAKLTSMEREAFEWAVSGLQNALGDELFLEENPEITYDPSAQFDDILYRLEDQAKEMDFQSGEGNGFSRACKRVAVKIRGESA